MKELYISPELNVICFAPVERLANTDDLLDVSNAITTYGAKESSVDADFLHATAEDTSEI